MSQASKLVDHIVNQLFMAENRRLKAYIDKLVMENREVTGQQLGGFLFQGKWYPHSSVQPSVGKLVKKPLAFELEPRMLTYLADEKLVSHEKKQIHQILFKRLLSCFSNQDVRDAIPDCLTSLVPPEIGNLERVRNESFFANHPKDDEQYRKAKEKIEFYSAARLMY